MIKNEISADEIRKLQNITFETELMKVFDLIRNHVLNNGNENSFIILSGGIWNGKSFIGADGINYLRNLGYNVVSVRISSTETGYRISW